MARLKLLLQTGLSATEELWPPLRQAYEWLHQAAHLLANEEQHPVATLKESYERLLSTMTAEREKLGELAHAVTHFCKVTVSYWEGLFACYQLKDLPRTNNGLEHYLEALGMWNDGRPGAKALPRRWWCEGRSVSWQQGQAVSSRSLPASCRSLMWQLGEHCANS